MMKPPISDNAWPHSVDHSLHTFQHFQVEISRGNQYLRYKFVVDHTLASKKANEHGFGLRPALSRLFGVNWCWYVPFPNFSFYLSIELQNTHFVHCYQTFPEFNTSCIRFTLSSFLFLYGRIALGLSSTLSSPSLQHYAI